MEYRNQTTDPQPRLVNRLRLKHWALLAALAETTTLQKAASEIGVSQPSATKMLADIETAFQFALFERHPRGLRPTPLGGEVLTYAVHSQGALVRFIEDLEIKRRGGHGLLVVGSILGAGPDLVARAVAEIKRDRPLLSIRLLGETSDQIGLALERREVELAVGRFTTLQQHTLLDFTPLSNEQVQLVVRRGHQGARRRSPTLADLIAWPWIMQPLANPTRQLLEQEFSKQGLASPVNVVDCGSVFAMLQLLQTSDAVAALPESVVRDHVNAGLLRVLPVPMGAELGGFGILTRRGEVLSEIALAFVGLLHRFASASRATVRAGRRPARPLGHRFL